ncbi:cilia- and flagella-associated protein 36-like [Argopecten irradians]|uniref:cilia- and flagella-associated protein 36-like n=1 Tax=Argopecten irradians TaxID=31199 RepID=UPI003710C28D
MAKRSDWVYDQLLCFLGNPLFQIPVITYMEEHCLIFDMAVDICEEHHNIHKGYNKLVEKLLEGFIRDSKLTHDELIKALADMNAKPDLREIFQVLFEQILCTDQFDLFVQLMNQKNIELQQQALLLIMKRQGSLPSSLQEDTGETPPPSQENIHSEEEVLRKVLMESEKQKEAPKGNTPSRTSPEEPPQAVIATLMLTPTHVHAEGLKLEEERTKGQEKIVEAMQSATIDDSPKAPVAVAAAASKPVKPPTDLKSAPSIAITPAPKPAAAKPAAATLPPKAAAPVKPAPLSAATLPNISGQTKITGSQAAAMWMQEAQNEAVSGKPSAAVTAAAAELSKLDAAQLKQRQDYLKQQRDKLLAMKKAEREKQLLSAEQTQRTRPTSARVARAALKSQKEELAPSKTLSPEEEKKMAMRRAIASKLRSEMLDNN